MSRHFTYRSTVVIRAVLLGAPLIIAAVGWMTWAGVNSPLVTRQDVVIDQDVPFSHNHHVQGLGIDCRYCHTAADKSTFAGIPSTKTCMTCHSQIWTNSPMLKPVRDSWREGKPLKWNRVHNLPDYAFFNHQAHISHGVGCVTCHGQVDEMPLVRQHAPMTMAWCLDCHRDPAQHLRPRDEVFNMKYQVPEGKTQREIGEELVKKYHVRSPQNLSNCTICHR